MTLPVVVAQNTNLIISRSRAPVKLSSMALGEKIEMKVLITDLSIIYLTITPSLSLMKWKVNTLFLI